MRAEAITIENEPEQKMNLTFGVFETNLLDCIIEKIIIYPHVEEESNLLDSIIAILKDAFGEDKSNLLDNVISRIEEAYQEKEELKFDLDETIFLTNLARHIGASGMRQYIGNENTIEKANNDYDEAIIDNGWQPECLAAFNEALDSKNCK